MDIKDFPNPKLELPTLLRDSKNTATITCFCSIDDYLKVVGKYIYTDINLDYQSTDPNHAHAWVQKIVSSALLRSLYLRNAFVEAINARNPIGMFLPLKAWFETVGLLAAILDLLEKKLPQKEFFEKLQPYVLGNRGKGNFRVGKHDAISVATMIEKADKYMRNITKERKVGIEIPTDTFFTDFYDMASNPSHPSFEAHEMVGSLADNGIWSAKTPEEVSLQIIEEIPGYGGLLMSPVFIESICSKIFSIEKEHFAALNSKKYFS